MKKLLTFILLIILLGVGYLYTRNRNTEISLPDGNTKKYINNNLGLEFTYPNILTASTSRDSVVLHHDIPFQNTGACDMMGDEVTYDRLTDFELKIRVSGKNLTNTVKEQSPYIPQENFVNNELVASPGFIDAVQVGKYKGFSIYEGAEGCGRTTYYFPIDNNKTLVVQNSEIQALNPSVRSKEALDRVLSVPGVIDNSKSKEIFKSIISSLETR